MILKNYLRQSPAFCFRNNIFCQRQFVQDKLIEALYPSLRGREDRVYSNDILKLLPQIPSNHVHEQEWKQRQFTLKRLLSYLKVRKSLKILELGCGNGWLCNQLAALPGSEVLGVDINEPELTQAADVFKSRQNLSFVHGDIFTLSMPFNYFDYVIFAASIQYFANPASVFKTAFTLLATDGEIHVVDSPIYLPSEAPKAQKRSKRYFNRSGFPEMSAYYYHHTWNDLKPFSIKKQYDPDSFYNRLLRRLPVGSSSFPWVIVRER